MALLGLFDFLEGEEGSAERVGPGQLGQSGRVHGDVLLLTEHGCNRQQVSRVSGSSLVVATVNVIRPIRHAQDT